MASSNTPTTNANAAGRCTAVTKSGTVCGRAVPRDSGTGLCVCHDPERQRSAARAGGAGRGHAARASRELRRSNIGPEDVRALLGDVMLRTLDGQLEPNRAAALATVARAWVAVNEQVDLEQRLTQLEQLLAQREGTQS